MMYLIKSVTAFSTSAPIGMVCEDIVRCAEGEDGIQREWSDRDRNSHTHRNRGRARARHRARTKEHKDKSGNPRQRQGQRNLLGHFKALEVHAVHGSKGSFADEPPFCDIAERVAAIELPILNLCEGCSSSGDRERDRRWY